MRVVERRYLEVDALGAVELMVEGRGDRVVVGIAFDLAVGRQGEGSAVDAVATILQPGLG